MSKNKRIIVLLLVSILVLFVGNFLLLNLLPKGIAQIFNNLGQDISSKNLTDKYLMGIFVRLLGVIIVIVIIKLCNYNKLFSYKISKKDLLLSIPFFIAILLNFSFSNLDNITFKTCSLMIIDNMMIGFYEELLFRGIILAMFLKYFSSNRKEVIQSVLISSILFGLCHLFNLFIALDILDVLLQVVYTFIIGLSFASIILRTKYNILLVSLLHGLYDVAAGFGDFSSKSESITFSVVLNVISFIILIVYSFFLLRKIKCIDEYNIVIKDNEV